MVSQGESRAQRALGGGLVAGAARAWSGVRRVPGGLPMRLGCARGCTWANQAAGWAEGWLCWGTRTARLQAEPRGGRGEGARTGPSGVRAARGAVRIGLGRRRTDVCVWLGGEARVGSVCDAHTVYTCTPRPSARRGQNRGKTADGSALGACLRAGRSTKYNEETARTHACGLVRTANHTTACAHLFWCRSGCIVPPPAAPHKPQR